MNMLEQLLDLKKRRERRLRQQVAAGNQRYEHLRHSQQILMDERRELQQAWQRLGEEGRGKLARDRLYVIQLELEEHFKRDKTLNEEIANVERECESWLTLKEELGQHLHKVRIDQEKLEWILTEGADAY